MRRVVVTGMGAITPIGLNTADYWEGLKTGKIGFDEITAFDTTDFKVKLAAEVRDFDPLQYMDRKAARRMEDFSHYAVAATREAMDQAGIDMEKEDPYRVGVAVGSGIGSLQAIQKEYAKLLEKGPARVDLLLVPKIITNMAAGNISIQFGIKGKTICEVSACATGTHNIGEAFRSIQHGECDVMVTGGSENAITEISVAGFTSLNALSLSTDPARCSIPFDADRNGFVIGAGAGILILEELEHAKARGAKILAEIVGYGATSDAHHITAPAEDGEGALYSMKFALADADVAPEDVCYINAHGTSTQLNDRMETLAIKALFGDHAYDMKINSTKSMIGHLLGGAGAVEAVACILQMNNSYIHETVGLSNPDEDLDLDYVSGQGVDMEIEYALSNSFAFGGLNASILIKKYHE